MTSGTSQTERNVRAELLHAAVEILDRDGPDALQTRKIAGAAGTSTMAVYTYFGGMPGLIAAVTEESLRQFDAALSAPQTDDPVADCTVVESPQSAGPPIMLGHNCGVALAVGGLALPASRSNTRVLWSSQSRLASTEPATPEPTTMMSYELDGFDMGVPLHGRFC